MGPDEEKRLRQLLFKKRQLPEPDWNLFNRATKQFSRARQPTVVIEEPPKPVDVPLLEDSKEKAEEAPPPPAPVPNVNEKEQAYEDLGIPPTASKKDIRNAYLKMAMLHHPDKGGDPEVFKRIKAAYDKLTEVKEE